MDCTGAWQGVRVFVSSQDSKNDKRRPPSAGVSRLSSTEVCVFQSREVAVYQSTLESKVARRPSGLGGRFARKGLGEVDLKRSERHGSVSEELSS